MSRALLGSFIAWSVVVGALILKVNPKLFSRDPLVAKIEHYVWNSAVFEVGKGSGEAVFYRGNVEREARFLVSSGPKRMEHQWVSEPFNYGIHNASKSSPVSDGKSIFVGSDAGHLYGFGLDGKLRWKFYLGKAALGIHSSPVVDDSYVYIGSYRGALYAIEKETGRLSWMTIVGETIGSAPLLYQDHLIVAVETVHPYNGYVVKVNRHTGKIAWKSRNLGEQSHSSPALSLDKNILVVGANNERAFGIDHTTGKILWEQMLDGDVKSTPIINGDRAFISTRGGSLYRLEIETGKIIWKAPLHSSSQVSPVYLKQEGLVVASGHGGDMVAVHAESGKEVWRHSFKIRPAQLSSPVVLEAPEGETILFYCEIQTLCLLNPKGKIISKTKTKGRITSSPFVQNGSVYVSLNDGGLEALRLK